MFSAETLPQVRHLVNGLRTPQSAIDSFKRQVNHRRGDRKVTLEPRQYFDDSKTAICWLYDRVGLGRLWSTRLEIKWCGNRDIASEQMREKALLITPRPVCDGDDRSSHLVTARQTVVGIHLKL
jgi:hypothetical protein